eukprot:SAG31_NODE_2815_length_5045_cov_3.196522_2_plen_119_part_00
MSALIAWSRGLQQGPPTADGKGHQLQAVVTLKHYDAQTVEDSDGWDRHNVSANISRYMLMDSYLPAFGIAIRAGAKGVMVSVTLALIRSFTALFQCALILCSLRLLHCCGSAHTMQSI